MKKILALALCALMTATAVLSVVATFPYTNTFDDLSTGTFVKTEDGALNPANKGFIIEVAKGDNSNVLRFARENYDAAKNSGADSFVDIFNTGLRKNGAGDRFVISYDIYLEKQDVIKGAEGVPSWQGAMLRMTPASGTQFQQSFQIIGKDVVYPGDPEKPLCTLQLKKWYNMAVVYDFNKKTIDLYINGDLLAADLPWTVKDTSATDGTTVRIGWASAGDNTWNAITLVDNVKLYNADKPENATGKKFGEKPVAPTTPATTGTAAPTFDIAVVLAAVSAVAASGVIISKKRK